MAETVTDLNERILRDQFQKVLDRERRSVSYHDLYGKTNAELADLLLLVARRNAITPAPSGKHRRPE